jgi:hypothetical protein
MRKIFIHLHIPKCGGSTISDFLSRNFGSALGNTNSILNDYQYSSAQVSSILDHFPNLKCLTGHKLSIDLPYGRNDLDITAFTWIRDPVDRFVSHYFYHRNHTTLVPEAKEMSLEEYIGWALEGGHQKMYIDGQCRFLADGDFDAIRENAENGRLLLFPLGKLEESLYTIANKFPEHFSDWRLRTRNVSKKDQEIPDDIRERVAPFVANDILLHDLAIKTKTEKLSGGEVLDSRQPSGIRLPSRKIGRFLRRLGTRIEKFGEQGSGGNA